MVAFQGRALALLYCKTGELRGTFREVCQEWVRVRLRNLDASNLHRNKPWYLLPEKTFLMDRFSRYGLPILTKMTPTNVLLGVKAWNSRPLNPACRRLGWEISVTVLQGGFRFLHLCDARYTCFSNLLLDEIVMSLPYSMSRTVVVAHAWHSLACCEDPQNRCSEIGIRTAYRVEYHNIPMNRACAPVTFE